MITTTNGVQILTCSINPWNTARTPHNHLPTPSSHPLFAAPLRNRPHRLCQRKYRINPCRLVERLHEVGMGFHSLLHIRHAAQPLLHSLRAQPAEPLAQIGAPNPQNVPPRALLVETATLALRLEGRLIVIVIVIITAVTQLDNGFEVFAYLAKLHRHIGDRLSEELVMITLLSCMHGAQNVLF